jgi:hypothetical protein
MSYALAELAAWRYRRSGSAKVALVLLATFATDDGRQVFPAVKVIAAGVPCTRSQVQRLLATLKADGVLLEVARGGSGPRATTVYNINVDALRSMPDPRAEVAKGRMDVALVPNKGRMAYFPHIGRRISAN